MPICFIIYYFLINILTYIRSSIYAYSDKMRRCTLPNPLYRPHSSLRHFGVPGLYTCVIWSWCRNRTSQNTWSTLSMAWNHRQLELTVVIELFVYWCIPTEGGNILPFKKVNLKNTIHISMPITILTHLNRNGWVVLFKYITLSIMLTCQNKLFERIFKGTSYIAFTKLKQKTQWFECYKTTWHICKSVLVNVFKHITNYLYICGFLLKHIATYLYTLTGTRCVVAHFRLRWIAHTVMSAILGFRFCTRA